jgi:small GTP-binding protein
MSDSHADDDEFASAGSDEAAGNANAHAVKLVFNGDGSVGKTTLLMTMTSGTFPRDYVPTVFDQDTQFAVESSGAKVSLGLWDTSGRSEYNRLRVLSYPGAHMMLFCVDCSQPASLKNVQHTLLPEVLFHVPEARRVLLVLKTDLRDNAAVIEKLKERREAPLSHEQCAAFAKKFGMALLEVSALRGDGMATIGERLVELALEEKRAPKPAAGGLGARLMAFVKTMIGVGGESDGEHGRGGGGGGGGKSRAERKASS